MRAQGREGDDILRDALLVFRRDREDAGIVRLRVREFGIARESAVKARMRYEEFLDEIAFVREALFQRHVCVIARLAQCEGKMLAVLVEGDRFGSTRVSFGDDAQRIHVHRHEGKVGVRDAVLFREDAHQVFFFFGARMRELGVFGAGVEWELV